MKANLSIRLSIATIFGVFVVTGCVTQSPTNTQNTSTASQDTYITGSRLAIKNTTEMIGLKTIDQKNIRDEKMFINIVKDGS